MSFEDNNERLANPNDQVENIYRCLKSLEYEDFADEKNG